MSISNYALIDHLDIAPGGGLSIITGDTGAGKSVMLGALSLIKGERADLKVIADKTRKAVVEASFSDIDPATGIKVKEADSEWDGGELILRREILPSGRSRAFVNDTPVALGCLEGVAAGLLDIHSQNSNSLLSDSKTQLALIDAVASNGPLLDEYGEIYRRYVSLRQQIKKRKEENRRTAEESEIIAFKLGQLDKLKPKAGELRKIEARHETLSNSEEIREMLHRAAMSLDGGEGRGALAMLDEASAALADVDFTLWEERNPEINERLRQCSVELKDILETIEDALGMTEYNPATLASLSRRMHDYYTALKNFNVATDAELEDLHKDLRERLERIQGGDRDTEETEREAKTLAGELRIKAAELTLRRKQAASKLEKEIENEARKLGLENLRFEITVGDAKLTRSGGDSIEFRAAFNKNTPLQPVGSIASGGEIARLMLAVKKITSAHLKLPTIIFDEIDTGVSGAIASRMGDMMQAMGRTMQIMTITHLPQVAVKGERHFKVYKEDRGEKTVSDVMLLTDSQREEEIGRMLAGEEIDEAALTNARSLLGEKRKR